MISGVGRGDLFERFCDAGQFIGGNADAVVGDFKRQIIFPL